FTSRKFWRFEDAYNDFKDMPKSGQVLPYDDYPMDVEEGQVFNVEYTEKGGGTVWKFYRSDGYVRDGIPYTEELE
ncbi:MAG: hypothetical protein LBR83_00395, partial [Clostridiales bacterium]|nr:hypothetical protein [Clostridiales bacterium]